jgi:hypothetical protein
MTVTDQYKLGPSEYDDAAQRFFGTGVKALMEAQGGVYSLVRKESISELPDNSLPSPDGNLIRGRSIELSSMSTVSYEEAIDGDLDGILCAMDRMAAEMHSQVSKSILTHISEICEQTGNIVDGPLSYDAIADALEHMEFSFDENGNHNISVVVSPDGAEKLRALGEPTAEQQMRLDSIINRRRDEWNARRRSRSLPSRRD